MEASNSLEEATRELAATRNPDKVDMALYAAQIEKWRDFDEDLEEAGQISRLKRERRKALKILAEGGGDGEDDGTCWEWRAVRAGGSSPKPTSGVIMGHEVAEVHTNTL